MKVPSWRPDVEGKADLVEEIVRLAGLDRVALHADAARGPTIAQPVLTLLQKRTRTRRGRSRRRGSWRRSRGRSSRRRRPPIRRRRAGAGARQSDLGGSLRHAPEPAAGPRLGGAAQCRSWPRRRRPVRSGAGVQGRGRDRPAPTAAAVRRGTASADRYGPALERAARTVDAFDAKADVLALLAALGVPPVACRSCPARRRGFIQAGRHAAVRPAERRRMVR